MTKYKDKYLLWFVEEAIFNPKYHNWAAGRMEIHTYDSEYAIDEIRFFTPENDDWIKLRDRYDAKWVAKSTLDKVTKAIREKFHILVDD